MINDSPDAADDQYTGSPRTFLQILIRERVFLALLGVAFLVAALSYPYPHIAMWVGFLFAGSIQYLLCRHHYAKINHFKVVTL